MRGLSWGNLYETYHSQSYDPAKVHERVQALYADFCVKDRKGIFENILGSEKDARLLSVRVFDDSIKKPVYASQTAAAKEKGISNCSYCAIGQDANKTKIMAYDEMDADHVAAWSKGGATDIANCEMLCKPHNRSKGNR